MSSRVCFLCVQIIDPTTETRKIRISTLCELMLSTTRRKATPQFEEDASFCEFCPVCTPMISGMEQIRYEMSLLEEKIDQKITTMRRMMLENGDDDEGGVRIRKLRTFVLRNTESEENTDDNVVLDEVHVKVEQDIGPVGSSVDDQFFGVYNSFSPTPDVEIGNEEEQMDPLKNEVEDDYESAFCIIPHPQKKGRGRPRKSTRSTPPRIKRKRGGDTSPSSDEPEPRKPKLKPNRIKEENILPETRSSPRIKNKTLPPSKDVNKTLKVSLKRLNPNIKKSSTNSDSSSIEDTKPEFGDNDYSPEIASQNKLDEKRKKNCPYKCTSCAWSYNSESALTRHIARDHSIPCFVATCSSLFRNKLAMKTHLKQAHPGVALFQCALCKKKFNRENAVGAHMVVRHEKGEKKFPCGKCGKSFALAENLDRHVKLHEVEDVKPIVCDVCDSRFEDDERLQRHVGTHAKRFKCDHCGLAGTNKEGMERHVRTHTGEKPEKCDQCGESFIDQIGLRRHIAREHVGTRDHVCDICGFGFRLADDLKNHLVRHDESKKPVCEICGEKFTDRTGLRSHLVKEHGGDPFVCDECGAKFTTSNSLKQHKRTHGDKPHKCDVCNAAFVFKQLLTAHMRKHTGERPYPCPHCDQAFKQGKHRKSHINRIHTPGYVAPIRYPCPHCVKGYQFNHHLQAHIRQVHTGERPFTCDQAGCDKAFAKKTSLYLHLKGFHNLVFEKKCKDRLPRRKRDEFPAELGGDHNLDEITN